jgi:hypothetical protein
MTAALNGMLVAGWVALVLAGAAVVAWYVTGPRDDPLDPTTPGRLFVSFYVLLIGLGSVWLVLVGESQGAGSSLAAYGLAAYAAGAFVAHDRLGPIGRATVGLRAGRLRPWGILALAAIGLLGLGLIVIQAGLPFLTGNAATSRLAFRGLAFDAFRWFVPPAAVLALALAWTKDDRRLVIAASLAVLAVLGLELGLASRALPLELLAALLLVAWWAGRRLRRRALVLLATTAVVAFVVVQLARVAPAAIPGGDRLAFAVERTVDRVVLIAPRTIELAVELVPVQEPYFGGATYVRRLVGLMGGETPPILGYWLFERLFPGQPGGFAAPGILAEAWVNGGPVLSLGGMFAWGIAGYLLSRWATRSLPDVVDRVFWAFLAVAFARAYATSLNGFVATAGALLVWRLVAAELRWPLWRSRWRPGGSGPEVVRTADGHG